MRFTVIWSDKALSDLAEHWLTIPVNERQTFSDRVDFVDRDLRENAHQKGASIPGLSPFRVLTPPDFYEPPTIGLLFEVSEPDRVVQILQLRIIPTPP